jgi:hypothetical protein
MRDVGALLTALRDRPKVVIHSPLPSDETLRRLRTGPLGTPVCSLNTGQERAGRRIVFGRVQGDRVRIHTQGFSSRNTQKILRARCVATAQGCTLLGTLALVPVAESLLITVLLGSLIAFAVTVVRIGQGHGGWAWAGVWLGVFLLVAALVCLDRLVEDRDEPFIKTWVGQRLQPHCPRHYG